MNARRAAVAVVCVALVAGFAAWASDSEAPPSSVSPEQIKGDTYRLERAYLVTVHAPNADVDRILESVATAVGLEYGNYDQVAYLDAPGVEQFRPRAGSKAGVQAAAERVPTIRISFSVRHDIEVLQKVVNAAHKARSYEEPVIYVREVWRSQATTPDDSNPNRWWNLKID